VAQILRRSGVKWKTGLPCPRPAALASCERRVGYWFLRISYKKGTPLTIEKDDHLYRGYKEII
jgi:hypothetical protein